MSHRIHLQRHHAGQQQDIVWVMGQWGGVPTYHAVRLFPTKRPMFLRLRAGATVDLSDYGTILSSGYGSPPTEKSPI